MISAALESIIRAHLSESLHTDIHSLQFKRIGGGSINETFQLIVSNGIKLFVKVNSVAKFPGLFEKERKGIELLGNQNIIRVPEIIVSGQTVNEQFLVLEWIEQGLKTEKYWTIFGEQLANQHLVSSSFFGLEQDNYMGALPQSNKTTANWIDFLINERFQPQIVLAQKKRLLDGGYSRQFETLYKKLHNIFPAETPSLLHGDLWSGNFLCDESSLPVLIDPAVYFGHRSMDLGMTTLFGGFDACFYDAYHYHFPFPYHHREQWEICNLYPLLIHLNLFGKSYLRDIIQTIRHY